MKKIVNFRPLVLFFFVLIVSIILGVLGLNYNFLNYLVPTLAFCGFAFALISFFLNKKSLSKRIVVLCFSVIFMLLGFFAPNLFYTRFKSDKIEPQKYNVYATVCSVNKNNNTCILDDVVLVLSNQENNQILNEPIKLKTKMTCSYDSSISLLQGDRIHFIGKVDSYFDDQINFFNNYYFRNGIGTSSKIYSNSLMKIENSNSLKSKIQNASYNLLYENMNEEEASVCFAILFGRSDLIDNDIVSSFRVSGIAHLLAVSGLHIGFLIVVLNFILNKVIKNKAVNRIVLFSFLIYFAYICNFTPSVTRAVIMAVVSSLLLLFNEQYDGLNSLVLSGAIILIARPFDLFDIGFQLSFMVIATIFMLSPALTNLFNKKMPYKFSSTLAVCVSAQLGSIGLIMYHFHNISTLAVLVNLVLIPIASVFYMVLFVALIICLILPFLGFVLTAVQYLFSLIILVAKLVSGISFASLSIGAGVVGTLFYYLSIIVSSEYVFLKKKYYYALGLFLCFIVSTILTNMLI